MRKVGILVIIGLLAITGVMAAMAYNTATVKNPATLTVESTDEALLSIVPKPADGWQGSFPKTGDAPIPGNLDESLYVGEDGKMHIEFGKGKNGKDFGLQPGSVYIWEYAFGIRNNSKEDVYASVTVEESLRPYVKIKQAKRNEDWKFEVGSLRLSNEPGRLYSIMVDLTEFDGDLSELTGSIIVNATAK